MVLAELLDRKNETKKKIKELRLYLGFWAANEENTDAEKIDGVLSKIYSLLDSYQQQLFLIGRVNESIKIEIGQSKVSLANAVRLRSIIQKKVDVLNDLISACEINKKGLYNILDLLNNRDKLLDEFYILDKAIKSKEWQVELGE